MQKILQSFRQIMRRISNISFRVFFICIAVLTGNTSAEDLEETKQWYQIEYIIFEHLQTDDHILRYEDTPYPLKVNKQFSYITNNSQPASSYQYTQLSEDKMDLADAYRKLRRNRSVEVLDMKSWQQALTDSPSHPLKINNPVSKNRVLFGELQLRKSRYTHAEFRLFLAQKKSLPYEDIKSWLLQKNPKWKLIDLLRPINQSFPFTEAIGTSDFYQNIRFIEESRRIKEGEIHYIDHPVLGIIVTIKEVQSPYQLLNTAQYD